MTKNKVDVRAADVAAEDLTAADLTASTSLAEDLADEDLQEVAGGGTFGDIYDALNESWTDIKKGFMDAWTD